VAEEKESRLTEQDITPILEALFTELSQHKDYQTGFEQRLYDRWKKPLDLFEITLVLGREVAARFNQFVRPYAARQEDTVFDVLARLHARSCQTGSAILSLLKSGHADDALARARTLHELHVTAKFINTNGNETAKRYRLYEVVESLKAAKEYEKHYSQLGLEPLDPDAIPKLEKLVEQYRTKFGEEFARKVTHGFYGWATENLGKKVPTFEDIEEAVGLAFMRPYYRMSSYPTHANAKGLTFTLGKIGSLQFVSAGPSNAGLADPGSIALSSFYQCTALLLRYPVYANEAALKEVRKKSLFADKVLEALVNKAQQAFFETHHHLVEEELLIQAEEQDNPDRRFVYKFEQ
jgi:hypothetical protein